MGPVSGEGGGIDADACPPPPEPPGGMSCKPAPRLAGPNVDADDVNMLPSAPDAPGLVDAPAPCSVGRASTPIVSGFSTIEPGVDTPAPCSVGRASTPIVSGFSTIEPGVDTPAPCSLGRASTPIVSDFSTIEPDIMRSNAAGLDLSSCADDLLVSRLSSSSCAPDCSIPLKLLIMSFLPQMISDRRPYRQARLNSDTANHPNDDLPHKLSWS